MKKYHSNPIVIILTLFAGSVGYVLPAASRTLFKPKLRKFLSYSEKVLFQKTAEIAHKDNIPFPFYDPDLDKEAVKEKYYLKKEY